MLNVMLDLETMGTGPDAAIVAVGAVVFDPEAGVTRDTFYCNVDLESAVENGGVIDASTVTWWLAQDSAPRIALTVDPQELPESLLMFDQWLVDREPDFNSRVIWGNGAAFDNVILRQAFDNCKITLPWAFRNDRCYRTLKALYPEVPLPPNEGTHHNALDDAIFQAKHLLEILKKVRGT